MKKGLIATIILFISLCGIVVIGNSMNTVKEPDKFVSQADKYKQQIRKQANTALFNNGEIRKAQSSYNMTEGRDRILLDQKLVDGSYLYIDLDDLNIHLEKINGELKKTFPYKFEKGVTIISLEYQPYEEKVIYKYDQTYNVEQIKAFLNSDRSEQFIKSLCDQTYTSKYQVANDVKVNVVLQGFNEELIKRIVLDKRVCS